MPLTPTPLPQVPIAAPLAKYERQSTAPAISPQLQNPASSQLGQYATQQLGGLIGRPSVAGQGVNASTTPSGANQSGMNLSGNQLQLNKTMVTLNQNEQRSQQLYQLRAQQKKQAQQQASGANPSGMYAGGKQGGYSGPVGKNQIPGVDGRLTAVGKGQYLANHAAQALGNLNAAFHAATGGNISVTEGWRSLSTQQKYYALHLAGKMPQAVAAPGHSVHGTGNAADLGGIGTPGTAAFSWLVNNAKKYGWSWAGSNFGESWHWEYVGG